MSVQDLKDLILGWIPDNVMRLISPQRARNAYYSIIDFFWDITGDKSDLETIDKSNLVNAINELKQDVGNATGFDITEIILTNGQSYNFPAMSKGEAFVIRIIENNTPSQNGMVWLGGYDGVSVGNDTVVICVSNSVGGSYSDVGYQFVIINQGRDSEVIFVDVLPDENLARTGVIYVLNSNNAMYIWDSQLGDYVLIGDVIPGTLISNTEFRDENNNVVTPEPSKLYFDTTTEEYYRWDGSGYVPINSTGGGDIEAIDVSYDDTDTQLGVDNTQLAIEKVYEKAIVKDYINIIDFGAVGDGVTESAQFIQDALDYAEANGVRRVYAPAGEYLLEKTIYIPTEIEFYGDGMDKTIFKIDDNTVLDVIAVFNDVVGESANFYIPLFATSSDRELDSHNNLFLHDFSIADIFYDDTEQTEGHTTPMFIFNTKNTKIESVKYGNITTKREVDTLESATSFSLSLALSENITIEKCIFGYAGYEALSIRFLCRNIKSVNNVYLIDKPNELAYMSHAMQVARPSGLNNKIEEYYGVGSLPENITSDGDIFYLKGNINRAVTSHRAKNIIIQNAFVVNENNIDTKGAFTIFDGSSGGKIDNNIIYIKDHSGTYTGVNRFAAIEIGSSQLNINSYESDTFTISNNTINLDLALDLSGIPERDLSAIVGNLRTKNRNVTITGNVVNVNGTGVRNQAVFGAYGDNIIISNNVVNFSGEVSENMRAFVVEGGDRINVVNNAAFGEHAYSLKVNDVEDLENLIIGANNFSSKVLNNQKSKTKTVAYIEDGLPINLFIQYSYSSVLGDSGINLIQPDLGLPILEVDDLQEDSSYSGELVLDYENNNIATAKVIELFGAEIYNNTNPSADITAKITFTLNFFNQVDDDIDYKLSWEYLSSGEVLFGEHTGTIDNTSNVDFELRVIGHSSDIFNLKKARLWRN